MVGENFEIYRSQIAFSRVFKGLDFFFKILNFFSRDFKGFFKGSSFSRVFKRFQGFSRGVATLHGNQKQKQNYYIKGAIHLVCTYQRGSGGQAIAYTLY